MLIKYFSYSYKYNIFIYHLKKARNACSKKHYWMKVIKRLGMEGKLQQKTLLAGYQKDIGVLASLLSSICFSSTYTKTGNSMLFSSVRSVCCYCFSLSFLLTLVLRKICTIVGKLMWPFWYTGLPVCHLVSS